jgi:hypothetical protein
LLIAESFVCERNRQEARSGSAELRPIYVDKPPASAPKIEVWRPNSPVIPNR